MPNLELKVGGRTFGGWTRVEVQQAMDRVAGSFSLGVTERYPLTPSRWPMHAGDSCTVLLAGKTLITGYIEDKEISYGKDSHDITIKGRDRTADLADCSHLSPPSQWRDQTLLQLAQALCKPFGIPVVAEAEVGEPFKPFCASEGDRVLEMIAKQCRLRALLPLSYGDGGLVLARTGSGRAADALKLGVNVERAEARFSDRERFGQYLVKGHGNAMDFSTEEGELPPLPGPEAEPEALEAYRQAYLGPVGKATDSQITRYRPLVILAEAKGNLQAYQMRATWEAAHRAGKSRAVTYTVAGWTQSNGQPWRINSLVAVDDPFVGLKQDMLIESLRFSLDDRSGSQTQINVVHPDAHRVMPGQDVAANMAATFLGD